MMPTLDPIVALRRFGLGARSGEMRRIAGDPRGFVLAALADKSKALLNHPDLDPSHIVFANAQDLQLTQKLTAQLAKATATAAATPATRLAATDPNKPSMPPAVKDGGQMAGPQVPQTPKPKVADLTANRLRRDALLEEASRRIERAVTTDAPLLERLVMFWSNHFCVSSNKGPVRGLAGGFEREAIRPHVLGRFADMLRAVEKHPAMLIYLDNQLSTGPNSKAGKGQNKGLNENLAREILELHTLGVDGGFTQEDVTNFARVLTGWQVGQMNIQASEAGKFFFAPNRHEPGAWTVAGRQYVDEGQRTGERVLDDLARHPATARYIATRIARHFVSETPPPALVAALEKTFRDSDGDLERVTKTLVTHSESWTTKPAKVVPPYDFVVSLVRGFGLSLKPQEVLRLASALGQPLWTPPSPKGWPDDDEAWTGPSAIRERLRIAEKAARDVAPPPKGAKTGATVMPDPRLTTFGDPREAADDLLGPGLSDATRTAIARAETREQGYELLMMAPEFLRR
jgi:uncharacterized protein (DUF1800 family)